MFPSTRSLRLCGAVVLTACSAGAGLTVAQAAEVPGAVTDVRLEETLATSWSQMRLQLDWKVPDGTDAGDTFTLRLPEQLQATDGLRFGLKDASGNVVANADVDGELVTFTMTDYAETHTGVHGSAWFWVRFTSAVEPGDDLSLVFEVGSTTFTDTITVEAPGPDDPRSALKWQRWETDDAGEREDRFLWAIDGPVVQENMVGSTYQIVDTPGPGQEIDCEAVSVWSGTRDGSWADPTFVAEDRWNLECGPNQVSVTVKPTTDEIGRAFRLLGESAVTDTTLEEYRNSGFVRLWGTAELPVDQVVRAGGGGDGTGEVPTPGPTTTTPASPTPTTSEPTTSTPTTPEPTTPEPTVTVTQPGSPAPTVTPEPTVTVTLPGSPAPTTTVTAPAPPVDVDVDVDVTVTPAPPVSITPTATSTTIVLPGAPAPTTSGTPDPTVTVPGFPAEPTTTVTLPGAATPTPTTTTTTPTATTTVTVSPGTTPAPAATPRTVAPASPTRIDSGVPAEGMNPKVAGAGGAIALVSGIGLLALSRRRTSAES